MQLVDNPDPYAAAYVSQGWASFGFQYIDSYDASQENNTNYGIDPTAVAPAIFVQNDDNLEWQPPTQFNYTNSGDPHSFYSKGGFVTVWSL